MSIFIQTVAFLDEIFNYFTIYHSENGPGAFKGQWELLLIYKMKVLRYDVV